MPDTAPTSQPDELLAPEPDGGAADVAPDAPAPQPDDGAQQGVHPLHVTRDASPGPARRGGSANLQRMLDVPLTLTVELGSTEMPLAEVLRLDAGAVVTIDRLPGEPIDLLINGRLFARGEVVVINETFGYRITELVEDADDSIDAAQTEGDGW